jgi:hypothetical protein
MHYLTRGSHEMQKHKLCIMSPSALLMETAPSPYEHEKYRADISHHGSSGMQYVTQMQKHKLNITCPSMLFVKSVPVQPEYEK